MHKYVGGAPCLDFVNTVSGRVTRIGPTRGRDFADRVVEERLTTYAHLIRWAEGAHVLSRPVASRLRSLALRHPDAAAQAHEHGIAIRESLYRLFKAGIEGWKPAPTDRRRLDEALSEMRAAECLVPPETDGPGFRWGWRTDAALERPLWPIIRSAVDLLTSESITRIRQCPGDACGWLFLDNKRGRPRRWCDMADCGNIAKVRRYRRRKREEGR